MRVFVAVNLPDRILEGLAGARRALERGTAQLKSVDRSGMHVTLCFVGEVEPQDAELLGHAVRRASDGEGPLRLALGSGGSFPSSDDARVVWVGVEGETRRLLTLQKAVSSEIRELGFRIDKRPFSPHVTLARVGRMATREERRRIAALAATIDCLGLGSFEVGTVDVMQSFLSAQSATYAPVAQIPLGAAELGSSSE